MTRRVYLICIDEESERAQREVWRHPLLAHLGVMAAHVKKTGYTATLSK